MLTRDNVLSSQEFDRAAAEIARTGRFLAERGWSPATSSNYSIRLDENLQAITRSGINKYEINPGDVIVIDARGAVVAPQNVKSSAETLIHTAIYKILPEAQAVLHTHSPQSTRLSLKFLREKALFFEGYEMQKGLAGQTTHDGTIELPILPNAQDMKAFALEVENLLHSKQNIHGFLIAGHGLYTWGKSMPETQRHIETFEFLMACKTLELAGV